MKYVAGSVKSGAHSVGYCNDRCMSPTYFIRRNVSILSESVAGLTYKVFPIPTLEECSTNVYYIVYVV